eukprot:1138543-Pelagomonas_calceolata.AAC.1
MDERELWWAHKLEDRGGPSSWTSTCANLWREEWILGWSVRYNQSVASFCFYAILKLSLVRRGSSCDPDAQLVGVLHDEKSLRMPVKKLEHLYPQLTPLVTRAQKLS